MNSFYSEEELKEFGFRSLGKGVLISRRASIYSAGEISFGDYVRVDDFCVLSGKVCFGSYIHIGVATLIFGGDAGVTIGDYSTLSSRCAVYAISDDYSGEALTNPMLPEHLRDVEKAPVVLGRHVIVGTGSTLLPGVVLEEGVAVGSMSLVNRSLACFGIYAGIPCKKLRDRSRMLLEKEKIFLKEKNKR